MSVTFIRRLLPSSGVLCSGILQAGGGFKHRWFSTPEDLYAQVLAADQQGATVYIAQASFKTQGSRAQINASLLRNFFLDLDCGPGKPFATQMDSYAALKEFCVTTGLPFPSFVSSGHGTYAHWIMDQDIEATQWRGVATILKKLTLHHKFEVDQSRTSDSSSVLRPIGVHNRKHGLVKPVRLLFDAPDISFSYFLEVLHKAAHKAKIETQILEPPKESLFKGLNDEFSSGIAGPESSLLLVADKCAQVKLVRAKRGDVSEPLWYDFIGLARHCSEGTDLIHEWSAGHPDYTPSGCDTKIQHHIASGVGPTTCGKFGADNPEGCVACPYVNKVKSPIVLGRPEAPILTAEAVGSEEEEHHTPYGFQRREDGLWFSNEGVWQRFYPYDMYVARLAYDRSVGYEVATVRHKAPFESQYKEFNLRSALLHDTKQLLMALADSHVHTPAGEPRKQMVNYMDGWLSDLRAKRALSNLHSQMGWYEKDGELSFALGAKVFRKDQEVMDAGLARNVPDIAKSFRKEGDSDDWSDATKYLGMGGMEPMAFAFLAGAFGAPLLRFTGYAGAMVALVGDSGIGKTLLGEWIMSMYGDSKQLILQKEDTKNFLVQRLGLYGSLPLYVDEISNIDSQEFSDLVYRVTQGRDKGRLNRSGVEREFTNSWNTIAVVSSNHSLMDKLSTLKADASAEINRIFEVQCPRLSAFGREESTYVYRTLRNNFGVGDTFIQYLVDHQEQHQEKIDMLIAQIDQKTGARPEERFWSVVAGTAIYGGLIAHKLGIIKFSPAKILSWVVEHILSMRENKKEQVTNQIDFLGQFLDEHLQGAMICNNNGKGEMPSMLKEPRGNLVYRINLDTHRLYIARNVLKKYLDKHYGSYTKLKAEVQAIGALVNADSRKVLGAGTWLSGSQTPVWEIDLKVPALGRTALTLVRKAAAEDLGVGKV